ncbi:T9SS type A sorting domain-containing protein [Kordia sp. YSTF-M3]|uniref:T9SS type A sorting domain-containing protein n=1 Tax=Kordia aestuariivivens TaxID=2759037 RepID=A0ABR7Q9Y3_9FLAO|nr:T9SS type A sorting domain-containing protein [Kordia aestuariivivens]MBC8755181.1 T9SS type A sorting domain-containing protein [Kordia aestuariivivens]
MKLKIFTLSTLFLFFSIKTTAQLTHAPSTNIVDITFLISDHHDELTFELTHKNEYLISSELDLVFRINLDYQSVQEMVGYFGLQYKIYKLSPDGFRQLIRGVTVPVVIPPVRKNRTRVSSESEEYPFNIYDAIVLEPTNYDVKMNLVKFHTRADYLANNDNYTMYPRISFPLVHVADLLTNRNAPDSSSSLITYPNPSINEVIIDYANTTQNLPVEVVIFNDKGIKVSAHTLIGVSGNSRTLYQLNVSHVPKGMYFYQIKRGDKTEVKTIIKK